MKYTLAVAALLATVEGVKHHHHHHHKNNLVGLNTEPAPADTKPKAAAPATKGLTEATPVAKTETAPADAKPAAKALA